MAYDGVLPINQPGHITAFIEHPQIKTQYVGIIDVSGKSALVGTDNHHAGFVYPKIGFAPYKSFYYLIGGQDILKTLIGMAFCTRIMSIKGDDVLHPKILKFLKGMAQSSDSLRRVYAVLPHTAGA